MSFSITYDVKDNFDDFSKLIVETENVIKKAGRKAGREGVNSIKEAAPVEYGEYKKSWSLRDKSVIGGNFEWVIHNRKYYMLVHLLEDGHDKVLWGYRTG